MKRNIFFPFLAFVVFFSIGQTALGQDKCLSDDEAKKAVELTNADSAPTLNLALQKELIDMQAARQDLEQKITDDFKNNQNLIPQANEIGHKNLLRLCQIVKENGWVRKELVGEDGMAAALSFLQGTHELALQREIFPVIAAAAKKGYVGNEYVAALVDGIRVGAGIPQIFGTQTVVRNELFYLYPLVSDAKVDEWRKLYNLPPLADFMKYLQYRYGMPVIKSPRLPVAPELKSQTQKNSEAAKVALPTDLSGDEVVKVESNLVNLNVRISANNPAAAANLNLQKDDFELYADGKKQDISFFSAADTPFDLILLLDLSGSTAGKQDLIRKSTRRFIEAARPTDRIAIVTFTDEPKIVADLTSDKAELLKKIKKIDDAGGSGVWLALQFVYDKIIKPESQGRRSAVVFMTDGVDSSILPNRAMPKSYPNFSDVLETVKNGETTVIPIYLDTESESYESNVKSYSVARQTLSMLGEDSGGQVYYAKRVADLENVYGQVINDLGKVYSLGYEPSEINRDGAWHTISVKIPKYPNLAARTKSGFYAK